MSRRRLRIFPQQRSEHQRVLRLRCLEYPQNQFGFTFGGPIKKDKTFIFGFYQDNRQIQGISWARFICPLVPKRGGTSTFQTQLGLLRSHLGAP